MMDVPGRMEFLESELEKVRADLEATRGSLDIRVDATRAAAQRDIESRPGRTQADAIEAQAHEVDRSAGGRPVRGKYPARDLVEEVLRGYRNSSRASRCEWCRSTWARRRRC